MRRLRDIAGGWGIPLVMLLVLMSVIEALRPGLLAVDSLALKVAAALTLIFVATGETIVVLRGGIDLSVGGTLSLASAIAATRVDAAGPALMP